MFFRRIYIFQQIHLSTKVILFQSLVFVHFVNYPLRFNSHVSSLLLVKLQCVRSTQTVLQHFKTKNCFSGDENEIKYIEKVLGCQKLLRLALYFSILQRERELWCKPTETYYSSRYHVSILPADHQLKPHS